MAATGTRAVRDTSAGRGAESPIGYLTKRMMAEADPSGEVGTKQITYEKFEKIVGVGHPSCLDRCEHCEASWQSECF